MVNDPDSITKRIWIQRNIAVFIGSFEIHPTLVSHSFLGLFPHLCIHARCRERGEQVRQVPVLHAGDGQQVAQEQGHLRGRVLRYRVG